MSEDVHDRPDVGALREQQCRGRVSEVVEAPIWETRALSAPLNSRVTLRCSRGSLQGW